SLLARSRPNREVHFLSGLGEKRTAQHLSFLLSGDQPSIRTKFLDDQFKGFPLLYGELKHPLSFTKPPGQSRDRSLLFQDFCIKKIAFNIVQQARCGSE